jgi:hypothetical protein
MAALILGQERLDPKESRGLSRGLCFQPPPLMYPRSTTCPLLVYRVPSLDYSIACLWLVLHLQASREPPGLLLVDLGSGEQYLLYTSLIEHSAVASSLAAMPWPTVFMAI